MLPNHYPDPTVSANLFCAGHIDRVLGGAIAPLWDRLVALDATAEGYLWFHRYDKGGEHLKLRIHGPETIREPMLELLETSVEPFLRALPEPTGDAATQGESFPLRVPPIDAEDTDDTHPDRSLRLTRYRHSSVILGPHPLIADEAYLARLTRCFAGSAEKVLRVATGEGDDGLASRRQGTLLELLIVALGQLDTGRSAYLRYHRDWLIRFPLLRTNASDAHGGELLKRFEGFCAQRGRQLEMLTEWTRQVWARDAVFDDDDPDEPTRFRESVAAWVEDLRSRSELPHTDPYSTHPLFPPLFKLLNGVANQVGISRFEEAFTLHLLLCATEPASRGDLSFRLLPFEGDFA